MYRINEGILSNIASFLGFGTRFNKDDFNIILDERTLKNKYKLDGVYVDTWGDSPRIIGEFIIVYDGKEYDVRSSTEISTRRNFISEFEVTEIYKSGFKKEVLQKLEREFGQKQLYKFHDMVGDVVWDYAIDNKLISYKESKRRKRRYNRLNENKDFKLILDERELKKENLEGVYLSRYNNHVVGEIVIIYNGKSYDVKFSADHKRGKDFFIKDFWPEAIYTSDSSFDLDEIYYKKGEDYTDNLIRMMAEEVWRFITDKNII